MAGHVFISYSRTDSEYVQKLASHLDEAKVKVWYDYQVDSGDSFGQRIQDAIDECVAFVAVLSPASVASPWVRREVSYATEQRKTLYPVVLQSCKIPIEFAGLHREDVTGGALPGEAFVRGLRASGHSGKWAEVVRHMHSRYEIADETPTMIKLVFDMGNDRSQVVLLWYLTLAGDEGEEWVQIESPIGPLASIDLNVALEQVQNTVCGGLAKLSEEEGLLTFRHSIRLTDFDISTIDGPMSLVTTTADRLEDLLTGDDIY